MGKMSKSSLSKSIRIVSYLSQEFLFNPIASHIPSMAWKLHTLVDNIVDSCHFFGRDVKPLIHMQQTTAAYIHFHS